MSSLRRFLEGTGQEAELRTQTSCLHVCVYRGPVFITALASRFYYYFWCGVLGIEAKVSCMLQSKCSTTPIKSIAV